MKTSTVPVLRPVYLEAIGLSDLDTASWWQWVR